MKPPFTHSGSWRNLLGESANASLVDKVSTEKQVSAWTPPAFIAHSSDDTSVAPENSLRYYKALVRHSVRAEMHLYERGGHGFGMRSQDTHVNQLLDDLEAWLAAHGLAEKKADTQ